MSKKTAKTLFFVLIGAIWAALSGKGKSHSYLLDMAFLSFMVFTPCLLFFWSEIRNKSVMLGFGLSIAAHLVALFFFRAIFPVSTILTLIPLAFCEIVMVGVIVAQISDHSNQKAQR
jgi:hypothetical protein